MNEEVTRRNVTAAIEHGNETRRQLQEVEKRVDRVAGLVGQLQHAVDTLRPQVAMLAAKVRELDRGY